jgi:hypothetical protein
LFEPNQAIDKIHHAGTAALGWLLSGSTSGGFAAPGRSALPSTNAGKAKARLL